MIWFDRLFPPIFLLLPLLMVLVIRAAWGAPRRTPTSRALLGALVGGTLLSLAVWAAALVWLAPPWARFTWTLGLPLFGLFIPLTNLRYPEQVAPRPAGTVRTASLVNRSRANPVPPALWGSGWAVYVAGLAVILVRLARPLVEGDTLRVALAFVLLNLLVPGGMMVSRWAGRRTLEEPEPLGPGGSAALARSYEGHRRARAWSFYLMQVVLAALVVAMMVALAWVPAGPALHGHLGVLGAVLGSLAGLSGAVFGLVMGLRRARINQSLRELAGEGDADRHRMTIGRDPGLS